MEDKPAYVTKDLNIASVLATFDIQPERINFEYDGKRNIGTFIYTRNLKKIANIIKDYFESKLQLEPQKLFYSMKNLKTRLYSINN